MNKTNTTQLPTVPSELILLALSDLALVESDPNYVVNMSDWHIPLSSDHLVGPRENTVCAVCLAGAVLAKSIGIPPEKRMSPSLVMLAAHDTDDVERGDLLTAQLYALDNFQSGDWEEGLEHLNIDPDHCPEELQVFPVTRYRHSPEEFRRDMLAAVKILQENNL